MRKKSSELAVFGCSRRFFLEMIGAGAAAAALAACTNGASLPPATTAACGANTCIDLTDAANSALTQPGGVLSFDAANDTIMVVRVSDTEVLAISAVCTHSGCIVDWNDSAQRIDCNCHGSEFGTDGHVIRGPANRPLKVYTASLSSDGNTITVTT